MFKFSFDWLKKLINKSIDLEELLDILNLQGFEVKEIQNVENDKVITIEVKANRPDILSHIGVAREICNFKSLKKINIKKSDLNINNDKFKIKINIENSKICKRFSGVLINNINNDTETPDYIKNKLKILNINCINPVVDILNYIMLEFCQPMHSYDIDKLCDNEIFVNKYKNNITVNSLSHKEIKIKSEDIVISDKKNVLCIAGIVGTEVSTVEKKSKNILIEAANFDEINIRVSSKRLKISTPSSFRFERGVNLNTTLDIAQICAERIVEICGGSIDLNVFDYYPEKSKNNVLDLRVSRSNKILGIELNQDEIINCLKKYDFICNKKSHDLIEVEFPNYRLDIKEEIDLIEEVARIYGYDNIESKMPKIQIGYTKNKISYNIDVLRRILMGLNFNEIISYSFIPSDTMKIFGIEKGSDFYSDLLLENPVAQSHSLMRPFLICSLLNTLIYNYSKGNFNLALFEVGKVYFKSENSDTKCSEIDALGFIVSGNRIQKGWEIEKNIKYTYYDILNYIKIIFDEFNQKFVLKKSDYKFCESEYDIFDTNNNRIGFICELNKYRLKNISNIKLLKDKVFCCEIYIKFLEDKNKTLKFESVYPSVNRLYNLVYTKNMLSENILNIIKNTDEIIRKVDVKDIYYDKNMPENVHAVLYEVNYCSEISTLKLEQIEDIENKFLEKLKTKLNVELKK
ncbi:MAG: phenylalanine--tRNA ligase subunit beta [Candidatus Paraimprobicoccus trichonymphae]|uniref:Phenylalanine--tRNA ligase beta subunit n=1 Tax=Candidatus Paraimprobicoccus trichonymphae TaxID=3033793 RepID=A0AA48HZP3_9FIRM|nr:MAG: phenylalanine--tRNA ligase subunit beta [Candidatus Paraimprobicoccus trichonymphae]